MIRPANAASIWIADDVLWLELPACLGAKTHTVHLTADLPGMNTVVGLLKARHAESKIGQAGDLTQWQLDRIAKMKPMTAEEIAACKTKIRRPKRTYSEELRRSAKEVLQKMGLI